MNPNDIFWLARYAHRQLAPFMKPLDARLQVVLDLETKYPGVQVWAFPNDFKLEVIAYKTGIKTQADVDALVTEVQAKASVTA